MKKKLILMLCVSLLLAAFSGCTTGQPSTTPSNTQGTNVPADSENETAAPAKIRVASWDIALETHISRTGDLLQERNQNVEVDYVDILNAEYIDKVTVMLAGGDDVDLICSKNNPFYLTMISNNYVQDVTPYVKKDNVDLSAFAGIAERLMVDDKLYGMPYRTDLWLLYYNKNLFDAAGEPYPSDDMTWEEYEELTRRLTKGEGNNKTYGGLIHFWPACIQNLTVQDGKNTVISEDYSFMKPYYEMALRLQNDKCVPDYSTIKTGNLHYSGVFYNGNVATVYMGTWFTGQILKQMKDEGLDFEWGVAKAPHPSNVEEGYVVGTAFPICINSKSKNPEVAWEYAKLLSGKEGANFVTDIGYLPAYQDEEILKKYVSVEGFPTECKDAMGFTNLSFEVPVHPKSGIIGKILDEENELIMTGSITLDKGIENLNRRVSEALAEE